MRAIDADILKKQILKRLCIKSMDYLSHAEKAIVECIDDAPTIEPERDKGRWIEEDDGWDGVYWRCSECDGAFCLVDGTPEENEYYFCPNCGAKMER